MPKKTHHRQRPPATLVELLRIRAADQGDKLAYSFLRDEDGEATDITYSGLDRRARSIAAHLQQHRMAGERVLLLFPPGLDYIAAFFGCLYAGAIAVPAYPPRPNRPMPRIQAILADSGCTLALTTENILSGIERRFEQDRDLAALRWVTTDTLPLDAADAWRDPAAAPATLAFLQYTSGSTGDPKGVMVSHGNLIHNLTLIREGFHIDPDGMGVTWLPMYHDMGLIGGILEPMFVGGPATLLSPAAFLQRPICWLQTITRLRGTISGGPNFAYQFCVEKTTPEQREALDLSSWECAFCGAEPVRRETLERFIEAFEPCGFRREAFYPCFGMAETTLMITGGLGPAAPVYLNVERAALERNRVVVAPDEQPESQSLVACGVPLLGQTVLVVHPDTATRCADDEVGEIWAAGPSIAQGYWNRPETTAQTFAARLADTGEGPFLRTGDLGFFHQGQVYITGRLKDLIIIRGRNHYPQDIERSVERCHAAVRSECSAAFSVAVDGAEQLVVVAEIERQYRNQDVDEVVSAIRRAVAEHHELQPYAVALIKTLTIPKTSSGKIQRRACRQEYLAGTLQVVGEWKQPPEAVTPESAAPAAEAQPPATPQAAAAAQSAEAIEAWLVEQLARKLGIPPSRIDVREPFDRYGLDSLSAVTLSGDLETWLGRTLSPTLVYEYSTIAALAEHLAGAGGVVAQHAAARHAEPIAIIGLGCRFPGGANDAESYWKLLADGVDAVGEVPADRWDQGEFFDADPSVPGKAYTRWGGFLEGIDLFDPQFFGIAPREAVSMDPQQRMFLEVSWEALENAGQAPDKLAGSPTGVFVGLCNNDYSQLLLALGDRTRIDAYTGTGSAFSVAAGRVSYVLGLHGPNLPVDTACSSSLVALHLACQSLRSGECRMALAGGVNALLTPDAMIYFSKVQAMARDGRCKTFDAAADGYVRGEGCGVVVLKRLADALQDGDRVLAVVRGSAVNHDGRSNGLTAPSGPAQEAVLRGALGAAGIEARDVGYLEAHGTGTPLGDPIEVRAVGAVLCDGRTADRPLVIGSVKTNIGHLEAAAGVAGLIKVVLSLENEAIPAHLHFQKINPHIPLEKLPLAIPAAARPWPRGAGRRIAGVSSFGFSGTNAHVIVEEPPHFVPAAAAAIERPLHVLCLSAKTPVALRELARRYADYFAAHLELNLADACYTANVGRARFAHRAAVLCGSLDDARAKLAALAAGETPAGVFTTLADEAAGRGANPSRPKVAMLFTGQGAQYVGMARTLYETQPAFRRALDECDRLLQGELPRPLLSLIYPAERQAEQSPENGEESPSLDDTRYTQPALFAVEYALAEMWRSWGVEPAAVMGHSVGEYVAACVAGLWSPEDALRLIAARARLMGGLPAGGRMAAVFADGATVEAAVAAEPAVSIAACNGPRNVVVSGAGEAVERVLRRLAADGIEHQELAVSHAFHSPLVEPILDEFEGRVARAKCGELRCRLIANLTGQAATTEELSQPGYWRRHARGAVRFAESVETLVAEGYDLLVEAGPQPTLLGMARRCQGADAPGRLWLPTLRKGRDDWSTALESLARLWLRGVDVDWAGFERDYPRRKVALPTYPFQRERYWLDVTAKAPPVKRLRQSAGHPLLGAKLRTAAAETIYESTLSLTGDLECLGDHRVYGTVVYPAAAYLETALAAAAEWSGGEEAGVAAIALENVALAEPLSLGDEEVTAQFIAAPPAGGNGAPDEGHILWRIASLRGELWTNHVRGTLRKRDASRPVPLNLTEIQSRLGEQYPAGLYYQRLAERGLEYGPAFQGIELLRRREAEALGHVALGEAAMATADRYRIHPALLDACFQLLGATIEAGATHHGAYVPVAVERIALYDRVPRRLWCRAAAREAGSPGTLVGDLTLCDDEGRVVAEVVGLSLRAVPKELLLRALGKADPADDPRDWLYGVRWQPKERVAPEKAAPESPGRWLLLADAGGVADALAGHLTSHGQECLLVRPGERFALCGRGRYEASAASPADFLRLLDAAANDSQHPLRGIVHLWSLDPQPSTLDPSIDSSLLHVIQAAIKPTPSPRARLWLVTRGAQAVTERDRVSPPQAALWGLARVAALEHADLRCARIDLDPHQAEAPARPIRDPAETNGAEALFQELWSPDAEDQVAFRGGVRHAARLARHAREDTAGLALPDGGRGPYRLAVRERGVLDNIEALPLVRHRPGPGEVEIEVAATGLNFRDVLSVLGLYPGDPGPLGGECAGRVTAVGEGVADLAIGDEVLGIASGSFASHVTTPATLVVHKPRGMSFADAATIPIAFLTAHYTLNHLGRMQRGERALIHAASGGVGLAALQLCKLAGVEVIGTAGSPAKHTYLHAAGVEHVLSSRTLEFATRIPSLTGGRGVDLVLNSLSGEFIPKSLQSLAPRGRFLEIGKADIWTNERMAAERPDVSYWAVALDRMVVEEPRFVGQMLRELMPRFESGELKPLANEVFALADAKRAFRHMAQARHIGKVVVTSLSASATASAAPGATAVSAVPQTLAIRPDPTYLITGGLGALGLLVAERLVERGARHIALLGRRAASDEAQHQIARLEAAGAKVYLPRGDVGDISDVSRVLAELRTDAPPLRGIVHAAGVLDDGVLAGQDWSRFDRVLHPKAAGAWNLHELTRDVPLDLFVLFGSVAGLFGSPGQGNYAAANAFLDGLAHHRRALGLPAVSIDWGPWAGAGMAGALDERDQRRFAAQGIRLLPPQAALDVLESAAAGPDAQLAVFAVDWAQYCRTYPQAAQMPLLADIVERGVGRTAGALREAVLAAPVGERQAFLERHLRGQVARILQIAEARLDVSAPLSQVGLDSLMAIELKNSVEAGLGVELPAATLIEGPSIARLSAELLRLLGEPADGEATMHAAPAGGESPDDAWLAHRRPNPEARLRLFCFHYLGGGASAFRTWQDGLPPEIEVCPVQLPGREERIAEAPRRRMEELVAELDRVLGPLLDRPFAVYGHSMGSLIGFEWARRLRRERDLTPVQFFAGGYFAPHVPGPLHAQREWTDEELLAATHRMLEAPESVLNNTEFMQALLPAIRADMELVGSYDYRDEPPLDCPLAAFGGTRDAEVRKEDLAAWRRHTAAEFTLSMLPGGHLFLFDARDALLDAIQQALSETSTRMALR